MGRAEVTLVWFLTSVHTKVTSEICYLYELPFAVRAVVSAKETDQNKKPFSHCNFLTRQWNFA